ncbi:adenosylcobinamide-GDP ribazoletransferase [Deinococcus fonticola]|uniref:adenosylcobinamide-GDP ribazoletransferase n=1 Tax=Deinococcus fonticola TaxID=2528713 RepID=UPI001074C439|nr:adenosylcobinamide-GDP ribazoletransferase [Deinococcus fonticola]
MPRDLRALLLALTFLTTLPFPQPRGVEDGDFARASSFYPLAGFVVGGVVALLLWLPLPLPGGVRAALALGAWLAVTGLLHFDGLVDSADALFVMKSPQRRLEILKDVHVGAFGLATGVLALLTLWSLLGSSLPFFAPVVAAVVARTLLLWPMNFYPAARPGSLGAISRQGNGAIALLLALPTLFFPGAWLAWLVGLLTVLVTARFAASRLGGGLTGDSYGFIIMVTELAVLCAYAWGKAG